MNDKNITNDNKNLAMKYVRWYMTTIAVEVAYQECTELDYDNDDNDNDKINKISNMIKLAMQRVELRDVPIGLSEECESGRMKDKG
jgi:hypothetical protein